LSRAWSECAMKSTLEEVKNWRAQVAEAAYAFERRWTRLTLKRVEKELAAKLIRQQDLFNEACVTGTVAQIREHGAAMLRGYAVVTQALERAAVEDDAYLIGRCPKTGTTVAIGDQKAAIDRVREIHGEQVVLLSPDEVATLFGSVEALKTIAAIKRRFPGAEVIDRHPGEPAKADSGILEPVEEVEQ
jgi:hypothetical protein